MIDEIALPAEFTIIEIDAATAAIAFTIHSIKYSVQFGFFEAEEDEEDDIPIAVIRHNGRTPNFEVDIIDMRLHEPPFYIGEGTCIAMGESCPVDDTEIARKDSKSILAGKRQRTLPNPRIFQQVRGLNIFSVCVRRNFISLSYRSDGLPLLQLDSQSY